MTRPPVRHLWILFMTRVLSVLLVSICAVRPVLAQDDQTVTIQQPFLWEFSPADSDVRSYLFGTIHVNDPKITQLHPQIDAAFDSATAVWFEIDFLKEAAAQTKAISLPPDQHLEDLVPKETVNRIDGRIAAISPLLSRTNLPEFQVIIWPIVLANLEAQVNHLGTVPMDMQLQLAAREAGKQTGGLEDAATQLKPLTDLSLEEQISFLNASLDVMDEDDQQGINQVETLVSLYAAGDGEAMQTYLNREMHRLQISEELQKLFVNALLMERNASIVKAIHSKIESAPDDVHFVAVGTAHLLGEGSMIEYLRQAGYTVRRAGAEPQ